LYFCKLEKNRSLSCVESKEFDKQIVIINQYKEMKQEKKQMQSSYLSPAIEVKDVFVENGFVISFHTTGAFEEFQNAGSLSVQ